MSKDCCLQNTKEGEYEAQVAESVFMGLRAGGGSSESSEHTEMFTVGHGGEDFAEGICEVQLRVWNEATKMCCVSISAASNYRWIREGKMCLKSQHFIILYYLNVPRISFSPVYKTYNFHYCDWPSATNLNLLSLKPSDLDLTFPVVRSITWK